MIVKTISEIIIGISLSFNIYSIIKPAKVSYITHELDNNSQIIYPEKIIVSGLPFYLQGWNNIFNKTKIIIDDKPVYRMNTYVLYGFIPIASVIIQFNKSENTWEFSRDDFGITRTFFKNATLFGKWYDDGKVIMTVTF